MLLNVDEVNDLLNAANPDRENPNEQNPEKLFVEMCEFEDWDTDELWDRFEFLYDNLVFEMKDLYFCLIDDDDTLVYFELKFYEDYDQHLNIKGLDHPNWSVSMECAYQYHGPKDCAKLRVDLEGMGGTYKRSLEQVFE